LRSQLKLIKWKPKEQFKGSKSWFIEMIDKIVEPLAKLTKRKRKTQINTIRDEKEELTTDTTEIQRIIREYFEKLHTNK
jgi:hypothetical protein